MPLGACEVLAKLFAFFGLFHPAFGLQLLPCLFTSYRHGIAPFDVGSAERQLGDHAGAGVLLVQLASIADGQTLRRH